LGVVTSGEHAFNCLGSSGHKTCSWFTWQNTTGMLEGSDIKVTGISNADCIIVHGVDQCIAEEDSVQTDFMKSGELGGYAPLLEKAQSRALPMYVANPDMRVMKPDGSLGYMPGMR
jgi:hypothetical protein